MKKTLKVVALATVLSASMFMLTGCGEEKKNNNNNKPANTQSTSQNTSSSNNSSSNNNSSNDQVIQVPMQVRNMVPSTSLTELYISGAGQDRWSEDLLGGQQMPTGTQMTLNFNIDKNNIKWDIKAVDEEGTAVEFRNLDLSNVSTNGGTITLSIENGTPVAVAE